MFDFIDSAVVLCAEHIQKLGGSILRWSKGPPATADQIERVARKLGKPIPVELIQLGQFASTFDFTWIIDQSDNDVIARLRIPHGSLCWDLNGIYPLDPRNYWWAEEILAGERDGEWHSKTIIDCAPDGDFLAYTLDPALQHVPVYCAKDGCGPSELVLGRSLAEFYLAWSRIGFLSINNFYEWPRRTGMEVFDVSYFSAFEALLNPSNALKG
jgi:hypothetical protein